MASQMAVESALPGPSAPVHELATQRSAGNAVITVHGRVHVVECRVGFGGNTGLIIRSRLQISVLEVGELLLVELFFLQEASMPVKAMIKRKTVECCGFHNDLI